MLDTNICIGLLRKKGPHLVRRLANNPPGNVGISTIVLAELQLGVEKSSNPPQNQYALEQFLLPLAIADFDQDAAVEYGQVRAQLERLGTPIGPLDTLIAAHALSLGVTLVTNNTREFSRVVGLRLEDWTRDEG